MRAPYNVNLKSALLTGVCLAPEATAASAGGGLFMRGSLPSVFRFDNPKWPIVGNSEITLTALLNFCLKTGVHPIVLYEREEVGLRYGPMSQ